MIVYDPFWKTAKDKGLTLYALIHKCGLSNGTLYRMRKGKPISTVTLNQICTVLGCKVEDVLLFVEDKNDDEEA